MKVLDRRRRSREASSSPRTPTLGRPRRTREGRFRRLLTFRDRIADALRAGNVRDWWRDLQRKLHLTRTGQVAVLAAIVPWAIAYLVAGKALYIFAYGTLILVAASYLLAPRGLKLEAIRDGLRPRAQQGDRLEVRLKLSAARGVSTFVLEERLPERLGTAVKVPVPRLGRGGTVAHRYSLLCRRRGVYTVGPLVAVTSDPLGLTERETLLAPEFELLVHPRVEIVADRPLTRRYEDPPIRPPVSKPWPSGLEFYGMREYAPGDDLRRIVWRASARTGKLMVREAEEGITDSIMIIVDTDRGSHSWDGDHSESFETAVRAAASLGVRHIRDGYELRNESNAGPLTRPLRGSGTQLEMLDAYARVDLSREPLTAVIRRLIANPRRDAHIILITPHLDEPTAAQLRLVLQTGVSMMVVGLLWDDRGELAVARAAALGCQVTSIAPGQELASALSHDIGAGSR
jgi:uncharacterized protein (DUF58 family)